MLLSLAPAPNAAAGDAPTRAYLIGTGLLCDLDPSACPAIAMADNDTLEVTGEGTLTPHPRSVTGGGTFRHEDAAGNLVGEGTWTAEQLLGFDSYGTQDLDGFIIECGLALIRVTLLVGGTPVGSGILQVDCLVGEKIPAGATSSGSA